jgi:predicted lipoprotein with Yx(FWY)xxD motif
MHSCPNGGQYVPSDICNQQWMDMCNNKHAGPVGDYQANYGDNGCQQWTIAATGHGGTPYHPYML